MQRHKILIVDDDDDVRESLLDELGPAFEVDAVSCGSEALDVLGTRAYDVVISDLRMPDLSGIEVLEAAKRRNPEVIRILLTGYLDEDARRATLLEGAPFKIGKPWHDEIDVTLRRALEQREANRRLVAHVADALSVGAIDDELAAEEGLVGIAQVLVRRAGAIAGVDACQVALFVAGDRRVLGAFGEERPWAPGEWVLDEMLTHDGSARVSGRGRGGTAREILSFLISRARRWSNEDMLTRLARKAWGDAEAQERLMAVSRRATLGAMSASMLHELASVVQSLQSALGELTPLVGAAAGLDPGVAATVQEAQAISARITSLFRAMRVFLQAGGNPRRRCAAGELVARAVALCAGYARGRCRLRPAEIPWAELVVDEPLVVQVIVNLVRNAVDVSGRGGAVDLEARVEAGHLVLTVTDDGPGVAPEIADRLFQPFATTKDAAAGSGLGLAISAEIVRLHGGRIAHERCPGRGARFSVVLPLAPEER